MQDKNIIKILKNDGIGIMPTDTIYGIVGSAYSRKAVERIYKIKKRDSHKPFIILISSIKDLENFGIHKIDSFFEEKWPKKTSVILKHTNKKSSQKFKYLNRDADNLAFRLPDNKFILNILKKTGPVVATSVNPQGLMQAQNMKQAKEYFMNEVDFFLSGGKWNANPSNLIEIQKNGEIKVLRGILNK
ncbi:Sua5/YciO/YrdC/YwlC family protein [Candidatus Nomurabacteria bacterium]|nr:Sua5/YciO/YrdC/YwlC family protein [Candidatus Nomurabacteria bacterium]